MCDAMLQKIMVATKKSAFYEWGTTRFTVFLSCLSVFPLSLAPNQRINIVKFSSFSHIGKGFF